MTIPRPYFSTKAKKLFYRGLIGVLSLIFTLWVQKLFEKHFTTDKVLIEINHNEIETNNLRCDKIKSDSIYQTVLKISTNRINPIEKKILYISFEKKELKLFCACFSDTSEYDIGGEISKCDIIKGQKKIKANFIKLIDKQPRNILVMANMPISYDYIGKAKMAIENCDIIVRDSSKWYTKYKTKLYKSKNCQHFKIWVYFITFLLFALIVWVICLIIKGILSLITRKSGKQLQEMGSQLTAQNTNKNIDYNDPKVKDLIEHTKKHFNGRSPENNV